MERVILSAPFGNYLSRPGCTSTLGTYTWQHRAGPWLRLWRVLSTVRYYAALGSCKNRLGLPNPGLPHLYRRVQQGVRVPNVAACILSILGFNDEEWRLLVFMAYDLKPLALEINDSCPNVARSHKDMAVRAAALALEVGMEVVVKLSPLYWLQRARKFHAVGVRHFHCCNTMSTPGGGLSGKVLKPYSLWAVNDLRKEWGDSVALTGGGGITTLADVSDYQEAGVDRVAVASMLFNPFLYKRLTTFVAQMQKKLDAGAPSSLRSHT